MVKEIQYDRKTQTRIPLSDTFFDPEIVYKPGKLDQFLVGLASQPSQKYDNIISEEVTNHLFQAKNKSFGMDLVSLNIQREEGRQGPPRTETLHVKSVRSRAGLRGAPGHGLGLDSRLECTEINLSSELYLAPEMMYASLDLVNMIVDSTTDLPAQYLKDCFSHILIQGNRTTLPFTVNIIHTGSELLWLNPVGRSRSLGGHTLSTASMLVSWTATCW